MSTQIRLSSQALGRGSALRAAVAVPLIATGAFSLGDAEAAGRVTTLVIIAIGVLVGVVAVAGMVTRVTADADGVRIRRLIGLERHLSADTLGRAVLVTDYEQYGAPLTPKLLLVDRSGRRLLNLPGHAFETAELVRLLRALPCEQVLVKHPMTPAAVHDEVVAVVPWWERHPFGVAFIVVGAVIVLVPVGVGLQHL